MTTTTTTTDSVRRAARELALSIPFGDAAYLGEQLAAHYLHRTEMAAGLGGPDRGAARALLDALTGAPLAEQVRILGDPAVRATVDGLLIGQWQPSGDRVLRLAALGPADRPPSIAPGTGIPLSGTSGAPWIWTGDRSADDPFGGVVRRLNGLHSYGLHLASPDPRALDALTAGAALLAALSPDLAASALAHVRLVGVVAGDLKDFLSLTNPWLPGAVFLSPGVLTDPWRAAEMLLHEAMHAKFIDLEHTHAVLAASYRNSDSPGIIPDWHAPERNTRWTIKRSLTVMHVYVTLAVFFSLADGGRTEAVDRSLDRAVSLHARLSEHPDQLGHAGRLFLPWIGGLIADLRS